MNFEDISNFSETKHSDFPEGWGLTTLGKVCVKIGSGITPRGGEKVYKEFGVALVRSQNVYNNSFNESGLVFIDEIMADKMAGVALLENDILLNITGDSVARCCTVPKEILPARVNQHVSIIRTADKELNPKFLRYYLTSPKMQKFMLSIAQSGGTRNALTKSMIGDFVVPKPLIAEQNAIVEVLDGFTRKIKLNQQLNKTLESIAQTFFKHWFIDFEFPDENGQPYRSSGGEMVDSKLGKRYLKVGNSGL